MTTDDSATPTRAQRFGAHVAAAARAAGYDIDSPRGGGKKALAEAAGMSHASVSRMLAGQTIPDPSFFEPLARVLHVPIGELLVISGLVSRETLLPEAGMHPPRKPKAVSPRDVAEDLGIKDPAKIEVFETMVRALLSQDADEPTGHGRESGAA